MQVELEGRIALVTGAAQGIGQAIEYGSVAGPYLADLRDAPTPNPKR